MTKNKFVATHLPCPSCSSRDAFSVRQDNTGYCFSCCTNQELNDEYVINKQKKERKVGVYPSDLTKEYKSIRGIDANTFKHYNSPCLCDSNNRAVSIDLNYTKKTGKIRNLLEKKFISYGDMSNTHLFGKELFSAAQSKAITITEGELDAMSVFQMMGSKYPSVSVRSSSSAKQDCTKEFEYINSFEKIYLCFDNDQQGQEAQRKVAELFDSSKVYFVKMTKYKDANEYLVNGEQKEFVNLWYNAKRYTPKGIVGTYQDIEKILDKEDSQAICSFPFTTLQDMTYGIREGEVVLITAQEKIGKTEFIGAIEYHCLKSTDNNIGIIHLEETEKRTVDRLVGYELGVPCHLPDAQVSKEQKLEVYKKITGNKEDRVFLYQHFGSDDPEVILSTIRYLAGPMNCKLIFLDHISMVVSGLKDDDERKKLDYISTKLAMMAIELGVAIVIISHVNDHGQTRGSRNISKVAHTRVHLERNKTSTDPEERKRTYLTLVDCRFSGQGGSAGTLMFNSDKFKLEEEVLSVTGENVF